MRTTKILLFITLSLSAFSQCALVYNPFTNQFNCGGASGTVGGASNLTTVGAIPYVSAAGILNQDPTALFWDAANDRATFGSGVGKVQVGTIVSGVPFPGLWLGDFTPAVTNYVLLADAGSGVALNAPTTSQWISFRAGNTDRMRLTATTGNLLIGTTTDSNFKLDVAASGSAGTMRVYGGAGVSDVTKVSIRQGGGQSFGSYLLEFQNPTTAANIGGFQSLGVSSVQLSGVSYFSSTFANSQADGANFPNSGLKFSSTASAGSGSYDLSLSRASAGVLQVGDGGSNANGTVLAASLFAVKDATVGSGSSFAIQSRNATNNNLRVGIGYSSASGGVIQAYEEGVSFNRPLLLNPSSGNVLIGTTTDSGYKLEAYTATDTRVVATANVTRVAIFANNSTSTGYVGTLSASPLSFRVNDLDMARFATTGNLLIGTTTDNNFRLDIATSGSSGTFRVYDQTATTGVTRAVIRAGAGQSTTNLTEWQNAAGVVTAYATSAGEFGQRQSSVDKWYLNYPSFYFANAGIFAWSSTADAFGARDIGIARSSAGLLEINSGTAGTYRDLILRRSQHNGVTVADLPTAAAGNAGSIQYVTDANATTIGSTVAGGGANKVMVWSDGAAWKIFAN